MKAAFLAALLLSLPAHALASSDDAWADLDRNARAACSAQIKKSADGAKVTSTDGTILGIGGGDGDLYYGVLLTGTTAGTTTHWLCLYDKRTKKADAREVDKP